MERKPERIAARLDMAVGSARVKGKGMVGGAAVFDMGYIAVRAEMQDGSGERDIARLPVLGPHGTFDAVLRDLAAVLNKWNAPVFEIVPPEEAAHEELQEELRDAAQLLGDMPDGVLKVMGKAIAERSRAAVTVEPAGRRNGKGGAAGKTRRGRAG